MSTIIIGCEADFRNRKRISREEQARLIRRLKEYVNLSYESEATVTAKVGVTERAERVVARARSNRGLNRC